MNANADDIFNSEIKAFLLFCFHMAESEMIDISQALDILEDVNQCLTKTDLENFIDFLELLFTTFELLQSNKPAISN